MMSAEIPITVLMTVFNGGGFVKESVDCILRQTYRHFELLIIDDCSTDNCLDFITEINDPRIRLVRNPKNIGQTNSLNEGLALARGKYVARMDADDLAYPLWLESQLQQIKSKQSCVVVSPLAITIDKYGKAIKPLQTPPEEQLLLKAIFASPINHVGCLMDREVVVAVGGYDASLKIVADYGLWSLLLAKGYEIAVNPQVLVAIRVHSQSVSMREANNKAMVEMLYVMMLNLSRFTTIVPTNDNVEQLWKLNFASGMLDDKAFNQAVETFQRVYENLLPSIKISPRIVADFIKHQLKVMYVKRVIQLVTQGDIIAIRHTAISYMARWGQFNLFSFVFILSYLGNSLSWLVNAYNKIIEFRTSKQLQIK